MASSQRLLAVTRLKRSGGSSGSRELAQTTPAVAAEESLERVKRVLDRESADLYQQGLELARQAPASVHDGQLGEVLDELLNTEANYLRDMHFVVNKFAKPMRELLDSAAMQSIFSNLATILELHAKLSEALPQPEPISPGARDGAGDASHFFSACAATAAEGDEAQSGRERARSREARLSFAQTPLGLKVHEVASAFIAVQPFFKSYAMYCANYPYVGGALTKARSEPRLAVFLDRAEAMHNVTLMALLFRPVQRMCVRARVLLWLLSHAHSQLHTHGFATADAPPPHAP